MVDALYGIAAPLCDRVGCLSPQKQAVPSRLYKLSTPYLAPRDAVRVRVLEAGGERAQRNELAGALLDVSEHPSGFAS